MKAIKLINKVDYSVAKKTNWVYNHSKKFLFPFFNVMTALLKNGFIYIVTGLTLLLFISTRKLGLLILLSILVGLLFTNLIIKNIVRRTRPYKSGNEHFTSWWEEAGKMTDVGSSFPSGHTTSAAAVGMILFLSFDMTFSWIFLIIPVVIGFSRIYYMVHYLSDVLGGLLVGLLSALLSIYILNLCFDISWFLKVYNLPSIVDLIKHML